MIGVRRVANRKINFGEFVKWLEHQINTCKMLEENSAKRSDYGQALLYKEEWDTYDFILGAITSDDKSKIPDFIEVEE